MLKISFLVIVLAALPCQAFALDGRVVRVIDGDTVVLLTDTKQQVRVRLSEIDAPERSQAYGAKSKNALIELCAGKSATLHQTSKDRYGRTLARLYCGEVDANAAMVEQGFAWVYDRYVKDQSLYSLQNEAKDKRLGLWRDAYPIAPWEYRRTKR